MGKYVVGVDIGGTKIAAGAVSSKGEIKYKLTIPTLSAKGVKISLGQVYKAIEDVFRNSGVKRSDIKGIGLCAPGPLDPEKGVVHNPPNLKGWHEVPLSELVRKKFKKKTFLENDANAAGMAEVLWGKAKGYRHVFYITISTGIGTGIIIDGRIYHGKNGMAGEGGHVTIKYDEKEAKCNCGNPGCIEALASGTGTVKHVVKHLKKNKEQKTSILDLAGGKLNGITMEIIGKSAKNGDRFAKKVIKNQAELLGIWIGSMISVLDPEIIIVGGGVSLMGDILFKELRRTVPLYTINRQAVRTPILHAGLKKDVGILGAASILL